MILIRLAAGLTLGLGTLLPMVSLAQGYAEGLSLSYEALPLQLTADDTRHSFRADVYRANLILPLLTSADSSGSVLVGTSLEHLRFSGERPGFPVRSVTGLLPLVGYRKRVSPQLELTALALPALNSDLRDVQARDLTWGGVVRAGYRTSARRAYRLTLGYRQQFYGPQYIVLLGIDWQLSQRWRAFGDLPTTFTLSYAASPRFAAGFNLNGINTAYRLQDRDRYFQLQQGLYGLFAEAYLSTHWAVRATAAYAVTRRLAVFAQPDQWAATIDYIGLGQEPTPLNPLVEKGLAFKLALSYRVPTP